MKKLHLFMLALLLVACGYSGDQSEYEYVEEEADYVDDYDGGYEQKAAGRAASKEVAAGSGVLASLTGSGVLSERPPLPEPRMIIKNGELRLEVDDFDKSLEKVHEIAVSQGGFVSTSTSEEGHAGVKEGEIRLRVPSEKFEETMTAIKAVGEKTERESRTGRDVTEEFFDLEARLKNKKRTEQRFQAILQKAGTIKDVLEVERELDKIREVIEQMEGRKKYLQDRVSWSTIDVKLHEEYPAYMPSEEGVLAKLGKGFKKGFYDFFDVLSGLIYILIAGLPIFGLIALLIWIIVKLVKRFLLKPKQPVESEEKKQ